VEVGPERTGVGISTEVTLDVTLSYREGFAA
jgi:hypothetical protein